MKAQGLAAIQRWAGDSERWLAEFLNAAPNDPSIVAAVVMGSAIRNRGHRRSDLDVLVLYRERRPILKPPLEVDARLLAFENLDEKIWNGHEVLCWALRFGTAIYDPIGCWEGLLQSWITRLPLPSALDAATRGRQALARATDMLKTDDESAADDLVLAAVTQFARERLIRAGVFPASRPELPEQLRSLRPHDELATILDDAMFKEHSPDDLVTRLTEEVRRDESQGSCNPPGQINRHPTYPSTPEQTPF